MRKVYLFPTECEAAPFRALVPDAEIIISGVGMAMTAATVARIAAEHEHRDMLFVLAGIAGAYGDIAVGSVVEVVSECCVELPERFREHHRATFCTKLLPTATSNTVHGAGASAEGAEVENMEGAALYVIAESLRLSATEIRAISNRVNDHRSQWRIDEATQALARELLKINNL